MAETISFTVPTSEERLDQFLSRQGKLTRSQVQKLIREGQVTVNDRAARPSQRLRAGDRVGLSLPSPPPLSPLPEQIPLTILYHDDDLIIVDKPPGLPVHPAPGHAQGTLINALLARFPHLGQMEGSRPGIIHRLDKDTSGLLVVAQNEPARLRLSQQWQSRSVVKRYLVLVRGRPPTEGIIEAPIARHPKQRQRMAVVEGGREARTSYQAVRYLNGSTLVEVTIQTGRTHQIRVHFSAIGHPVMGDRIYGVSSPHLPRQFVHAIYLCFRHPTSGEELEFHSPLPTDLAQALEHRMGLPSS